MISTQSRCSSEYCEKEHESIMRFDIRYIFPSSYNCRFIINPASISACSSTSGTNYTSNSASSACSLLHAIKICALIIACMLVCCCTSVGGHSSRLPLHCSYVCSRPYVISSCCRHFYHHAEKLSAASTLHQSQIISNHPISTETTHEVIDGKHVQQMTAGAPAATAISNQMDAAAAQYGAGKLHIATGCSRTTELLQSRNTAIVKEEKKLLGESNILLRREKTMAEEEAEMRAILKGEAERLSKQAQGAVIISRLRKAKNDQPLQRFYIELGAAHEQQRMLHDVPSGPNPISNSLPGT